MNELDHLKDLGREVPLPSRDELAPARARLVAAMNTAVNRRRRPWLMPASAWTGVAVGVVVAAGVALGLQQLATPAGKPPTGGPPTGGPPASSAPATEAPKTVTAAATVLRAASAAAIAQPFLEPRPDQFLYLETRGAGVTRRDWLSMDGTHDSLLAQTDTTPGDIVSGCRNGQRGVAQQGGPVIVQEPCTPEPAYLPDAPTDPQAMLAYLRSLGGPGTNSLAKNVLFLAEWSHLRPPARAALYEAAALIDGVDIVPNATDGAGRPGIGVGWSYGGGRTIMVFDPNTHALLGFQNGEAIIRTAVVDAAGQLP